MLVAEVTAHGPPDVLRLAERPDPSPGRDEVVVRIRAANVNPTDVAVRSGRHPRSPQPPFVPGWDLAGDVAAVGEGIEGFAPGDRVVGMIPWGRIGGRVGAYAEAAAVDATWLAPLDGAAEDAIAATLPLNALTARQALDRTGSPRSGRPRSSTAACVPGSPRCCRWPRPPAPTRSTKPAGCAGRSCSRPERRRTDGFAGARDRRGRPCFVPR